jgi:hypothetical protein
MEIIYDDDGKVPIAMIYGRPVLADLTDVVVGEPFYHNCNRTVSQCDCDQWYRPDEAKKCIASSTGLRLPG